MARVDPNVTVVRVLSRADQVAGNFRKNRLLSGLTSAYGVLALALAFLGLYAVTSSTVARRTREIGIRIALLSTGTIAALLYSVQPRDPLVIGGAALVLPVSTVIAAAVPTRRAARVEPTRALRNS